MAIRMNDLRNFKGEKYITQPELKQAVDNAISGSDGLIGEDGNLKKEYNPISVLSMDNPTPGSGDVGKKDQDFDQLKFIGNCKVMYGADGKITIRIGDNLNCSLFNGKDGISTTTVTSEKEGDSTGIVSQDYVTSKVSAAAGSMSIFAGSDNITAKCGSGASTGSGLTDGSNGNEVHFDDNVNGKFKVYIKSGKDMTQNVYVVGPITKDGTYYGKLDGMGDDVTGIKCQIDNFGTEPKSDKGASGYSGNVNFTIVPANVFSGSQDFQLVKIEMLEGTSVAGTWNNSTTNGKYFYLKETDKPGTPSKVSYSVAKATKKISGVTYHTTSDVVTINATGLTNIGYPASTGTKVVAAVSGDAWCKGVTDTGTENLNWTDKKGVEMDWTHTTTMNIGEWNNPQVKVHGNNYLGAGDDSTSSETGHYLVCDEDGYTAGEGSHGSFSEKGRLNSGYKAEDFSAKNLINSDDLQIANGYVQYPSKDYTNYGGPNYSTCDGEKFYYCKLSKAGDIMGGMITLVTVASPSSDLGSKFKIELSKNGTDSWMDISKLASAEENAAGNPYIGSSQSLGTTSKLGFAIPQQSLYGNGVMYVRIAMSKGCGVKISSISLA